MTYDPYREHMQQAILCAQPLELVVMLYEGLGEAIETARQSLRAGDIAGRARAVSRAIEIVAELSSSLDLERGGDLGSGLARLYDFISARLQEGNFLQQDQAFSEAAQVVSTLQEAWRELCPQETSESFACSLTTGDMNMLAGLSACG